MEPADQFRLVVLERSQRDETVRRSKLEKILQSPAAAAILRQPRERTPQPRLHRRLAPDLVEVALMPLRLRPLEIRHFHQDQRRFR